ncbi:hypothetical protein Leryth_003769 [Lithospermum erythrorhizon]|nr:hypothetical protein Leryth_003769 [Lithospermum erythrorhizon]
MKFRKLSKEYDLINKIFPDELIIEIFQCLGDKVSRDAVSLVCKRWLDLERLSRDTIRLGASGSPDCLVRLLATRFSNVKNVFIDERLSVFLPFQYGRRRSTHQSAASSVRLRVIDKFEDDIDPFSLSDDGLAAVADCFLKLEKLSLIWCSNATNTGLKYLAEKCTLLKSLDLQGCHIGDSGVAAVMENCKHLEELNFRFCDGLTDTGLVELANGCGQSLKSLGVSLLKHYRCFSRSSQLQPLQTPPLDPQFIHDGVCTGHKRVLN